MCLLVSVEELTYRQVVLRIDEKVYDLVCMMCVCVKVCFCWCVCAHFLPRWISFAKVKNKILNKKAQPIVYVLFETGMGIFNIYSTRGTSSTSC